MAGRKPRFRIYKARNGQWGWTLKSANGRKIATAGETFVRRADAAAACARLTGQAEVASCEPLVER